ncbi:uncharacterized protein EV420DRAFT_124659 [Desarmillaria tabescens]|uniref:RRM domain-containing protein n=1 Tax=Armillaria tabescens TaxID=1929756 RepID=A0AA39TP93_ARMTA|nr:uncharacterized protein EV420DRAFT_124659 [Desarmillaria tabescens]KAK0461713.1 hypothetical protein EV420DRAFT_124659 [Desarmillaria tabescens]
MLGLGRALCHRRSVLSRYLSSSSPNDQYSFRRIVRVDNIPQQLGLDLGAIDDFLQASPVERIEPREDRSMLVHCFSEEMANRYIETHNGRQDVTLTLDETPCQPISSYAVANMGLLFMTRCLMIQNIPSTVKMQNIAEFFQPYTMHSYKIDEEKSCVHVRFLDIHKTRYAYSAFCHVSNSQFGGARASFANDFIGDAYMYPRWYMKERDLYPLRTVIIRDIADAQTYFRCRNAVIEFDVDPVTLARFKQRKTMLVTFQMSTTAQRFFDSFAPLAEQLGVTVSMAGGTNPRLVTPALLTAYDLGVNRTLHLRINRTHLNLAFMNMFARFGDIARTSVHFPEDPNSTEGDLFIEFQNILGALRALVQLSQGANVTFADLHGAPMNFRSASQLKPVTLKYTPNVSASRWAARHGHVDI